MSNKVALSGEFPEFSLKQLVQTIEISSKTGQAKFYDNADTALVNFKDGKIINAYAGGREGEEALWALFRWETGRFDVFFGELEDEVKIDFNLPALFEKEAEKNKAFMICSNELPAFRTVLTLDQQELLNHIGKISDETGTILKLFDGQRTIEEVLLVSTLQEVDTLEKVVELFDLKILIEGAASMVSSPSNLPAESQALNLVKESESPQAEESLKPLTLVQQKPASLPAEETKTFFEQERVHKEPLGGSEAEAGSAAPPPEAMAATPSAGELAGQDTSFDASQAKVVSVEEWKTSSVAESGISQMAPAFNEVRQHDAAPEPVHKSAPPPVSMSHENSIVPGAPVGDGQLLRSNHDVDQSSEHIFQQGQESQANWKPLQNEKRETSTDFEDLDDSLDRLPRSKAPLVAGVVAGVVVLIGLIAFFSGGEEAQVTENAETKVSETLVAKKPATKVDAAAQPEKQGGFEVPAAKKATPKKESSSKPVTKKAEKSTAQTAKQPSAKSVKKIVKSHLKKGMSYYKSGKTEKAIAEFKEVVALDATHDGAHAQLGAAYFDLDQNTLALEHLKKAVATNSKNAQAVLLMGNVYQSTNRSADARKSYERYLEIAPDGNWADDVKLILKTFR
ncbi:MAG: DUF4388 domain-containing protein [Myxococcota bacterium]|nr:DUF4388 domain-containing protein [Myxococcota bacterium]